MTAHCSGCVFTVCVCVHCSVCVHFGWVKCRARILSMGHHTWLNVTSLHFTSYLPSAFTTCVSVAVNTSHSGMIVLALVFDLTHGSFSRARCGGLCPKQLFFSCLLRTHMRVSQLSCKLHQEVHPSFLPSGACLIQHMCIQCCHVNHVIEHGNWPAPCPCADSVLPHHLVHHIHAALCGVVKGDSVWLPFGGIISSFCVGSIANCPPQFPAPPFV